MGAGQPDIPAPGEERAIFKARGLSVIGVDAANDLALLKSAKAISTYVTFRGGQGVRTGEDIVVAGFPLHGLLTSDINVTTGTISALAGPGDDRRIFQITAPVQPGNSGGPVLDTSGHVVGVVVARLDALKMARRTGRLPQNVNFAISEGAARAFLDTNDVPYKTARSDRTMPTVDIAAKAKGYTVLIECWK
jgi:S1-C subfamily serine protease